MNWLKIVEDSNNKFKNDFKSMYLGEWRMPDKMKRLEELARPLIKWLNEAYHPHVTAIVTPDGVKLVEDICFIPIRDYIRD